MKNDRFLHYILSFILLIVLVGCSNQPQKSDDSPKINDEGQNPFEMNAENSGVMGSIGHGLVNPPLDNNNQIIPLTYEGEELEIEYFVNASGKGKNVGFLIYVNGIPQPYKITQAEATYEYMHIFNLEEDNKDIPFTFRFTPVTGKKGDELSVTITSIYNPAFMPDMKETSSYGGYHEALTSSFPLILNENPESIEDQIMSINPYLSNIRFSEEPVTNDLLENHSGLQEITLETLEKNVLTELYFDNTSAMKMDHFKIDENGKVNITFKIFGQPGIRYRNIFYINHQPLMDDKGVTYFETELSKGEVSVIDVELDLDKLQDFNTFYAVSVPINAEDFPEDVVVLLKTRSILLYK